MNKSGLNKIVKEYNDGKKEEVEKGFVMYIVGEDAQAEFINIESKSDTVALLKGIKASLEIALSEWEKEKNK